MKSASKMLNLTNNGFLTFTMFISKVFQLKTDSLVKVTQVL